jgi:type I restriction enzyme S subunit
LYSDDEIGRKQLRKGDLIIEKSGGGDNQPVGRVVVFNLGEVALCSNFLEILRPQTAVVDSKFAAYVMYSIWCSRVVEKHIKKTTGIQNLDADSYFDEAVPLPTLAEQERIADYLDTETARMDALVAEKERMLALLEEKRSALVSHAVTRGLNPNAPTKPSGLDWLGDIPAHWQVMQLKRLLSSSDYGISDDIRGEGDIRVLRMTCIVDEGIDLDASGAVESVDSRLLLRRGDLLFNRTNSLDQVAKVGLLRADPDRPTTFASYLVRLRTNERALPEYLVVQLNSRSFLAIARANAIPAIGQANLNPTRYGELCVPIPPPDEQAAILAHLAKERARTAELEEALRGSIALLKERRAALIAAAVTGQLELANT